MFVGIAAKCVLYSSLSLSIIYAYPSNYKKGFPSREGLVDIRSNFNNPPKGYGNVPFYWWNGDSLKLNRLNEQLEILSDAAIDGFSVSYIHTHPGVDVELNSHGYGSFGRADAGCPEFYSDDWWKLWNDFSYECSKKNIGIGVDDYVIGWAKNGFYVDEVLENDNFRSYQGRLNWKVYDVKPYEYVEISLPENVVSVMSYPEGLNLYNNIEEGKLKWHSSDKEKCRIYITYTTPSPELHPEYGKRLVETYFNRFEEKLDENGRKGLNYFFQDELHYNLNIHSWCEDMPAVFKERKGYDIVPFLPALYENIGDITPKVRLDYAQIVTELSEERYFKPIFDWHNSRGLIYGCDNNGRGLEPLQYMDYFRTISWFTAPGNDAPAKGSSFIQTKVSSSVSHLYQRPRTWLEAFHSMGWDSNGEWLTSQLDHHIIAGGNLVCMHGLYYSTHGGWWEWAPPCFHFRMPYWPHMKRWLKYAERMSFLLSQGLHVCDVAILYPTESMQAYPDAKPDKAWEVAHVLTERGIDYDFIDYNSLLSSKINLKQLSVSGENYKVLILPDIKAMHYETLEKVYEFYKKGGIIIATGELPKATTRRGENDKKVEKTLSAMFSEKAIRTDDVNIIPNKISEMITVDFRTKGNKGKVLHRRVKNYDVYMVMNVTPGDEMFFRAKGKVEYWNAANGCISEAAIIRQDNEGTWIKAEADYNESRLIVFSPGEPKYGSEINKKTELVGKISMDGLWNVRVVPTMDNKWGDFRLPATDELIGPEIRELAARYIAGSGDTVDVEENLYGYAPYFETITLPLEYNVSEILKMNLPEKGWKPYCFSWQYGVKDNPGSQGYHGLKGKVDNRFIILDQGGHQIFRTCVMAEKAGLYRMEIEGVKPDYIILNGIRTENNTIQLENGMNSLMIVYLNTRKGDYVLSDKKSNSIDLRERSAVVFYPYDSPEIADNEAYGDIVAMKWYNTNHLQFSPKKFNNGGYWLYSFQTAPGATEMEMEVNGCITEVLINGVPVDNVIMDDKQKGCYILEIKDHDISQGVDVTVNAVPDNGYIGQSFWNSPIKMKCSVGKMRLGNWTYIPGLKYYSGGISYNKNISIGDISDNEEVLLDLGRVNATCEVKVNGKYVDTIISPPYKVNIKNFVKKGDNEIEVLVYSTLSNHYQSIPSAYRGNPESGLLGPVEITFLKSEDVTK